MLSRRLMLLFLLIATARIRSQEDDTADSGHDLTTESSTDWVSSSNEIVSEEEIVTEQEHALSIWPFDHHDKKNTSDNGNDNGTTDNDNSCGSHLTCETCTGASSWCHWCGHDQKCHAKGSIHGCFEGVSCNGGNKDKNDTEPSGCAAHTNCSECALSSHLCHWCAFDNACHAVGSIHGCVNGVDCYSNDRCQRTEPEALPPQSMFSRMGMLPFLVIAVVSSILVCCASTCFCVASGIKGAYDDLAELTTPPAAAADVRYQQIEPLRTESVPARNRPEEESTEQQQESENETQANNDAVQTEEGHATEYVRLVERDELQPVTSAMIHPARVAIRPRRHMQRLYNACIVCYAFSLLSILSFAYTAIRFFPKVPEYNICNDSVAWKSLMDSLTSMKVTADFELLASISNPNNFDVALDMGRGSFSHNELLVGTFDIPPTTAEAMSITDVLIVAHLSPDKWEALSLTSDYYQGKLVLTVSTTASLRIPSLFDYSKTVTMENIVVHVNEMSERHLCHCPTWSDTKNRTSHFSKPEWV